MNPAAALLLAVAACYIVAADVAHAGRGEILWEDRIDFGGDDGTAPRVLAADGHGVFVVGFVQNMAGDYDVLVRAYDVATGEVRWQEVFDDPGSDGGGLGGGLGVTAHGGHVYVSGVVGSGRPFLRAYDARSGGLVWHRAAITGNTFGPSAAQGSRVFVAGGFIMGSQDGDWLVHAYDSGTGVSLWEDRFGTGRFDRALAIIAHGDRIFVGGRAQLQPTGESVWTVRTYDAASGAVLWQHAENVRGFDITDAQVNSIAVSAGRVIAAGSLVTFTADPRQVNWDWLVRTYDAQTGALLWEEILDKGGRDYPEVAFDVTVIGTTAFVAGSGGTGCGPFAVAPDGCDFIVRAYDIRNGALLWEHHQADTAPLEVAQVITAEGEQVFAAGSGLNDCEESLLANCDVIVKTFDAATGSILWADQIDSAGTTDVGQALAVHDDRLFVVGYSVVDPVILISDIIVRAYDAGAEDAEPSGSHAQPSHDPD